MIDGVRRQHQQRAAKVAPIVRPLQRRRLDLLVFTQWLKRYRRYWRLSDGPASWPRWTAVVIFSLSFFGSLLTLLVQPPAARADIVEGDGILIYSETGTNNPQQRTYVQSTNSFSAEADTVSSATPLGMTIKTSPIKQEAIAAYVNSSGTMQVMCYDGSTWTNEWSVSVGGTGTTRRFELEYEDSSGDAMVLYSTNTATTNELAYRTKVGTSGCGSANWASATNVNPARTSGIVHWVGLAADPDSDVIAAAWSDANCDLSAMIWTGSSWGNEVGTLLENELERVSACTDVEQFDLAYETLSSDLLIVWGENGTGSSRIEYSTCTGGGGSCTWGGSNTSSEVVVPTVADTGSNIDLAANPFTNEMVFGAVDNSSLDLSAAYWSGSAWTGTANIDTSVQQTQAGSKLVTAHWLINGSTTRSVIVYADSESAGFFGSSDDTQLSYVTGNGSTFTVATDFTTSPNLAGARYYKARKDPFHQNRLMLNIADDANDLFAKELSMGATGTMTWTNADGGSALETTLTTNTGGPFAFAYWSNVPTPAPTSIAQDGYIFENDDEDQAGGDAVDSNTGQVAGNTAITGVKKGERITVRFHLTNSGVDPLSSHLGLFYDRNDGYFVKAKDNTVPITGAGSCTDTIYSCAVVDDAAGTNTGQYSSMAMDPGGRPWIAYHDATNTGLWVAKYVGIGGTGCGASGSTAWTCSVVDQTASNSRGQYASLAFDKAGIPWISYYDTTNTNLKVAKYLPNSTAATCGTATTWDCTTVDNTANMTGQFTSIAFDDTNKAWVTYTYDNGSTKGIKWAQNVGSGGTGCTTATWACTVLDAGSATGIDYTSLQFDHGGKAYVAYYDKSATALRVANYVGGTNGTGCGASGSLAWTCATVDDNADDGSYASLLFGPTGKPWVSYYDVTNSALRVATKGGGFGSTCTDIAWTCGQVDNTGTDTGKHTALASDASGQIIVAYYDTTNTALRVARYVGSGGNCTDSGWNCSAVDNTADVGQYASAAADGDGQLWVAAYDGTNTALRASYVNRAGEIIPSAGLAGLYADALNVSHADTAAAGSMSSDADCLNGSASWNNGRWAQGSEVASVSLPDGHLVPQCTEVAFVIDTSQAVAGTTYRLIVAAANNDRFDRGRWRGPSSVAAYATLTIESATTMRYSKDSNPRFANCTDTAWGCAAVQTTNNIGQYTSMAVDPAGDPWMTYYDSSNSALIVARYVGSGGTGCANAAWNCITMESSGTTGQYSSIAFDYDGTPWISYYDSTNTSMKVARYVGSGGTGCASTAWTCTTVDNVAASGQYTSLAFSPNGNAWVSYYDATNTALLVAQYVGGTSGSGCTATDWSCTTVDNTGTSMGQYTSIGFDGNGNAWVSYQNVTSQQLRVAQNVGAGGSGCTTTSWTCTTIDTTTGAGQGTSISFDSSGNPWISYYDASANTALNVAQYVGSSGSCSGSAAWSCTQVDNTGADGEYSSIAFSANGNAWISYYESGGGDLRVARQVGSGGSGCTSSAWTCTTVDSANTVGQHTTLAFDRSGSPWVAYYDATGGNLNARIAKLNMPRGKPTTVSVIKGGSRSAGSADARFRLDAGLVPRNGSTACISTANAQGYCGLINTDSYLDSIVAAANEKPFYTFATRLTNNTTLPNVVWNGKSSVAASSSTLNLEVYRFGSTNAWESISTNTVCAANADCVLTGAPAGTLSEYYEADGSNYWVYFRVSQNENASAETLYTNSFFIIAPTTDQLLRHGQWFDPVAAAASQDASQPFFWAQ